MIEVGGGCQGVRYDKIFGGGSTEYVHEVLENIIKHFCIN